MTRFLVLLTEPDTAAAWEGADDASREVIYAAFNAFSTAVAARGSIVYGDALSAPESARTLGPGPDRAVTDGPFAETVEQVGGFYVIDVPDMDTALELAALLPQAYTLEVRECLDVEVS